jgi:hypothetical protein
MLLKNIAGTTRLELVNSAVTALRDVVLTDKNAGTAKLRVSIQDIAVSEFAVKIVSFIFPVIYGKPNLRADVLFA